jgi:hypothetical protein
VARGSYFARNLSRGTFFDHDVRIVTRLDRLARSTRDLLNTLAAIGTAKAMFVRLRVSMPAEPP